MRPPVRSAWIVVGSLALVGACTAFNDAEELLNRGGAAAATTTSGASATTSTTVATATTMNSSGTMPVGCQALPDDFCDSPENEGCDCSDCTSRYPCVELGCDIDDLCEVGDACSCADCKTHPICYQPNDPYCANDGECTYVESCRCNDCKTRPECTVLAASCTGGVADKVCDQPAEDCDCIDCIFAQSCVAASCVADGMCNVDFYEEACMCPDCVGDGRCACELGMPDGVCNPLGENCGCPDCAMRPECN